MPVEFDDQTQTQTALEKRVLYSRFEASAIEPFIVRKLKKWHIVKTANQAVALILLFISGIIFITVAVFVKTNRGYFFKPEPNTIAAPPKDLYDNPPIIKKK